jgi:hypothetical protein
MLWTLFVAVPSAYAHRPENGNVDGVTMIPDPTTSYAFYRELTAPDQVHVYRFDAEHGQFFHAGVNIPQIARLEAFGVNLALVGPELPPLSEHLYQLPGVDDQVKDSDSSHSSLHLPSVVIEALHANTYGAVVRKSVQSEDFYEPFTQTRYWGRQTLELDLPASGTYYLLIWHPDGESGKYVLDTGTEEVFGPGDLLRFPVWWFNTRVFFEQVPELLGILTVLFAGGLGFVVYRRKPWSQFLRFPVLQIQSLKAVPIISSSCKQA